MIQLLDKVYGIDDIKEITSVQSDTIWYRRGNDTLDVHVKVMKFAYDCKRWAYKKGYNILSDVNGAYVTKIVEPEETEEEVFKDESKCDLSHVECDFSSVSGNELMDIIIASERIADEITTVN